MRWLLIGVGCAAVLVVVAVGLVLWLAAPEEPGAFYAAPDEVPAEPGTLIRQEPYDPLFELPAPRSAPARGWLVVATDHPGLGTAGPHPISTA